MPLDLLEQVPPWVLMPVPTNAVEDGKLLATIDQLATRLPDSLRELTTTLGAVRMYREYDLAANLASAHVWLACKPLLQAESVEVRSALLTFAEAHMAPAALARICRRLVKDADPGVRQRVRRLILRGGIREVALPQRAEAAWDATGWLSGIAPGTMRRHRQGRRILDRFGLPPVSNLKALRKLLGINSPRQLGYFLLATDAEDGPYTRFTIPKRDGSERPICAPKKQLRWVQRQILDKILSCVPAHEAAHGFLPGRSTVTNATPHIGAELLLKFDLTDFFPTIHYFRVMGLFARLGYYLGNGRFSADDESRNVAPTLARLCCYVPDPTCWRGAVMPQGAPTSPALSNLVCRRLDARLAGLAKRKGGVYTRYADDLTFSFRKAEEVKLGRFRWWVDQICHQEGFFVNQHKFRAIRASQRQVVTGIVVNDVLRVPREERRRFRAILHNCRQHGLASQARDRADFAGYLRGFASYIHMVHPEEGADLLRQVQELLGPEPADAEEEA